MSQVEAKDAFAALQEWSRRTSDADLRAWKLKRSFATVIAEEPPIRIEGLHNAWCTSTTAGQHLLLLNIIATSR